MRSCRICASRRGVGVRRVGGWVGVLVCLAPRLWCHGFVLRWCGVWCDLRPTRCLTQNKSVYALHRRLQMDRNGRFQVRQVCRLPRPDDIRRRVQDTGRLVGDRHRGRCSACCHCSPRFNGHHAPFSIPFKEADKGSLHIPHATQQRRLHSAGRRACHQRAARRLQGQCRL